MSIEDVDTNFFLDNAAFVGDVTSNEEGGTALQTLLDLEFSSDVDLANFLEAQVRDGGSTSWPAFSAAMTTATTAEKDAFVKAFFAELDVDVDGTTVAGVLNDWEPLSGSDFVDDSSAANAKSSLENLFNLAFTKYLGFAAENIDWTASDSTIVSAFTTNATTGFARFASPIATVTAGGAVAVGEIYMPQFREMFDAFFPSATTADFEAHLAYFVDQQVINTGYFLPAHHFEPWLDHLRVVAGPSGVVNSLGVLLQNEDPAEILKQNQTAILLRVLQTVIEMIGVIQQVAVAQAERLNFLGDWQKAYSDLMAQMPTFTKGDESIIGGGGATGVGDEADRDAKFHHIADSDEGGEARTDLNQDNSAIVESLRTARDLVADTAKQLQTNVNQTNDAASAQANIATAILQQLAGILAVVFR